MIFRVRLILAGLITVFLSATPVLAKSVFMVCNGLFLVERTAGEAIEADEFAGAVYLTVDVVGEEISRVRLVPIERERRTASFDLVRPLTRVDTAASLPRKTPATGMDEGDNVEFSTSDDELFISSVSRFGPMVHAVIGQDPFAETPQRVSEMKMQLNRFSGAVRIEWRWHEVRDYLPVGAIRSIKKRYTDQKIFTADCDLMKQPLF